MSFELLTSLLHHHTGDIEGVLDGVVPGVGGLEHAVGAVDDLSGIWGDAGQHDAVDVEPVVGGDPWAESDETRADHSLEGTELTSDPWHDEGLSHHTDVLRYEGDPSHDAWMDSLDQDALNDATGESAALAVDAMTASDPLAWEAEPDGVVLVGTPDLDAAYWHHQEGESSCAVVSQGSVLASLTGEHFSEQQLAWEATQMGSFDPVCGTPPTAVGDLLEAHHVPVDRLVGAKVGDLYRALQIGEKVIVGLDANEIWFPDHGAAGEVAELPDAGHAVCITGFEMSEDGQLSVIMNDSGVPDGAGRRVAMMDFKNAWDDFGNFAVITRCKG
ncbi:MAG: hypothetical protein H6726_22890 [Sandaracinaceae bacterium]|nr:hypothetical protein [Sandaracinaceae bacterium]